jgi:hypothetical protein
MDLTRTPSEIAYAADEEIRALNHRTLDATTFEYPAQVADIIGALQSLTQRLDQTIGQVGSGLKHLHDQHRIGAYNGETADAKVAEAAQYLLSVQMLLAGATDGLRKAHEPLAGLRGLFEDVPDETLEQMDGGLFVTEIEATE